MTKEEAIKEIEEYISDADMAISTDEEYIRGWKSAMLVALEIVSKIGGQKSFTPEEVDQKLVIRGQNDNRFKWGETIRYSPSEVRKILTGEY